MRALLALLLAMLLAAVVACIVLATSGSDEASNSQQTPWRVDNPFREQELRKRLNRLESRIDSLNQEWYYWQQEQRQDLP